VDWFSDPSRIHHEALGITWLTRLTPPGTLPEIVFEDEENHILVMTAVPQSHQNWKEMLLHGDVRTDHIQQFARILADIHRKSYEQRDMIEPVFRDRSFFESLRVEPYYSYTATQQPQTAPFYEQLIEDTRKSPLTLVHGDYSPKNILIYRDKLVLLDHEVIHFGDPAFDIGFSMTHLLSKAHHIFEVRKDFEDAARIYWTMYRDNMIDLPDFERRSVRHTLACLLARVDGRSPLEYLSEKEQDTQRRAVMKLMTNPPETISELISAFVKEL